MRDRCIAQGAALSLFSAKFKPLQLGNGLSGNWQTRAYQSRCRRGRKQ
jgi:hypothetical protein